MILSQPQRRILEACDGRGILGRHSKRGILPIWRSEQRTVAALLKRGLVREVNVPQHPSNGITLTRLGADTLVPPGTLVYPV